MIVSGTTLYKFLFVGETYRETRTFALKYSELVTLW